MDFLACKEDVNGGLILTFRVAKHFKDADWLFSTLTGKRKRENGLKLQRQFWQQSEGC